MFLCNWYIEIREAGKHMSEYKLLVVVTERILHNHLVAFLTTSFFEEEETIFCNAEKCKSNYEQRAENMRTWRIVKQSTIKYIDTLPCIALNTDLSLNQS